MKINVEKFFTQKYIYFIEIVLATFTEVAKVASECHATQFEQLKSLSSAKVGKLMVFK